jgi:phosphoglycerate dehydrogenase-like enzyme
MAAEKRLVLFTINYIPDGAIRSLTQEFPEFDFKKSSSKDDALTSVQRAEILVMLGPNPEIISSATNCRWLQVFSAGVEDYLEIDSVKSNKNLMLTNVSGIHAVPISEHIFALLLCLTRGLKSAISNQEKKSWVGLREMGTPKMEVLSEKTMTLVGLGSIGLMTAKKAKGFGMRTMGVKRDPAKVPKDPDYSNYVDEIYGNKELVSAVSMADVIVNTLPFTKDTQDIFDSQLFSKAKKGCIFINVGRGQTVIEKDLIEALKTGNLAGAGLDVFDEEPLPKDSALWEMENVIVSPHISGWSADYFDKGLEIFKENLARYEKGEPLIDLVDKNAGY